MGRRAVGTTKTGRFMNPTDQARKEARKRELKKNKRQRMQVRTSVLKAREPEQILHELEEYDKMELDPSATDGGERLAVRVIQEKRRKLLETYERILSMVKRETPDDATKLVSALQEYEQSRQQRVLFYEQVRATENVDTSSIPLPSLPPGVTLVAGFPPVFPGAAIPPPSRVFGPDGALLPGILKPSAAQQQPQAPPRRRKPEKPPAGPPPGPPPELSDCEEELPSAKQPQQPQKTLRFSEEPAPPGERSAAAAAAAAAAIPMPLRPPLPPLSSQPPAVAAVKIMPPPHASPMPIPQLPAPGSAAAAAATASTAAGPVAGLRRGQTSISAAPQLKNLVGDATKLVPTALRVKRLPQHPAAQHPAAALQHPRPSAGSGGAIASGVAAGSASGTSVSGVGLVRGSEAPSHRQQQLSSSAKDDAYEKFMKEMQGLL